MHNGWYKNCKMNNYSINNGLTKVFIKGPKSINSQYDPWFFSETIISTIFTPDFHVTRVLYFYRSFDVSPMHSLAHSVPSKHISLPFSPSIAWLWYPWEFFIETKKMTTTKQTILAKKTRITWNHNWLQGGKHLSKELKRILKTIPKTYPQF